MFDPTSSTPQPPRKLGDHGLSLWQSVHSEYVIGDAAGVELLMQACECADRIDDPHFFHCAGPDKNFTGDEARVRHLAWADLPPELVYKWLDEREQALVA